MLGRSIIASHSVGGEDGREIDWQSAPKFKSEKDALIACGWVVELAQANAHLLMELADAQVIPLPAVGEPPVLPRPPAP